ncbi:HSP70/90 co-chaperone [Gnomoniopsis smithogilvyi]|uniref:HSP70/90 co-chaperone n=1 Tax=Gnomoniopsis smithogilvyi TaxID=1191159 RepID=A0A9W8YLD5_9PEZI|nr:HSP70/90 co-chaperone [Gnomoniopsis smithogilvyi]
MVHLEEITDKIETTLRVSEDKPTPNPAPAQSSSTQNASSTTPSNPIGPALPTVPIPALPPQLAHNAGKSVDEILADLNKSPLFMTELDDNNNTDLEALQALAYEGTPLENATDFKASGNEAFREKRWADAREFYGRGVALLTGEEKRRARGDPPHANDALGNDESEIAAQRSVLEALYVNRAACQLELGNHRQCWLDCAAALALNSRNVKAWYRSAKALLAVGRVAEADEACAGGLAVDANNGPLRAIAREIVAKAEADARKTAEEERRKVESARRGVNLRKALEAKGVKVRKSALPPDTGDARMELVEDENEGGTLTFPTVLLYPAHYESDFIKAFSEKETLMQHFGYVFPLPWDKAGEYSANGVGCFMETITGGLVKVGKKVALLKVVSLDSVEVVDGVVKIYVIPKAKAEGWVAEFKAAKAKEKEKGGT